MDRVAVPHGPIWHGATVLLVDNESTMRTLLRRRLEAENFHVEEAKDGERWRYPSSRTSCRSWLDLLAVGPRGAHEGSMVSIVVSIDTKISRHPRQAIRADRAGCQ
jgi:hypothetical protein